MASLAGEEAAVRPFRIDVPEEELVDLRRRILATRWPERETVADESQGVQLATKHEDALPLIVTHGWPGSIIEQLKIIGPLTDPTAHGGSATDAFHVVIPSM